MALSIGLDMVNYPFVEYSKRNRKGAKVKLRWIYGGWFQVTEHESPDWQYGLTDEEFKGISPNSRISLFFRKKYKVDISKGEEKTK